MNKITHPRPVRCVVFAGALTALALAFTAACSLSPGMQKVNIGKDEVRYTGTATEQEAKALGDSLKTQGYFEDRGTTVVLSKGTGGTIVSFVVRDGYWDKDEVYPAFEQMTRAAAPVVGGFPIKLQYMNTQLDAKRTTEVHPVYLAGNDEVRYSGTATEQDAKALADSLKTIGYLQNRGVTVLLSKGGSGTMVGFAVQDGAWNNDETVATFGRIGQAIAPAVGGAPLKVRMLNTKLEKQKEIPIG